MITIIKFFIGLSLIVINANAYTPARPVNSSQGTIENGANTTDSSKLQLNWFPNGSYTQTVSYRLAGVGSLGINKGAFVRFSESNVNKTTSPTTPPWIALISCDFNSTNVSLEEDILTLARSEGAIAAASAKNSPPLLSALFTTNILAPSFCILAVLCDQRRIPADIWPLFRCILYTKPSKRPADRISASTSRN
ncbi:hypothetical protein BDZ94DRAFT_1159644 [Collybia nuda]|uniref:Secreted protein n=1 Tax=Collybia nuda TaxID=64659 RepID=A0A9P5YB45_9AGAR|nr:hypothetical protein BDZ94DRAFT_1159644 [Collybia nuda]